MQAMTRDAGKRFPLGQAAEDRIYERTTGLKCPPDIGPNMRMIAARPIA